METSLKYNSLPLPLRKLAIESVLARITFGESVEALAKAFSTTDSEIGLWYLYKSAGMLESCISTNQEEAIKIDFRELPDEVRLLARKLALDSVAKGFSIAKTARDVGTSELTIRRWIESENRGFEYFQKRGRKHLEPKITDSQSKTAPLT